MLAPLPITPLSVPETSFQEWLARFHNTWRQGEHVVIVGQTGSGKTSIARDILAVREYVVVLAVKRNDDTIDTFRDAGYEIIKAWPPRYDQDKVVVWFRPKDLASDQEQAIKVYQVLNDIYRRGGYTPLIDDTGYVAAQLRLSSALTVLLSQARSSYISVVCALTQATSIAQRVPTETLRQVRHVLMFPYSSEQDQKALGTITGINWRRLRDIMETQMMPHDFLAFERNTNALTLIRNTRG